MTSLSCVDALPVWLRGSVAEFGRLGCGAHTDYGMLTVLLVDDVPGPTHVAVFVLLQLKIIDGCGVRARGENWGFGTRSKMVGSG